MKIIKQVGIIFTVCWLSQVVTFAVTAYSIKFVMKLCDGSVGFYGKCV